MRCLPRMHRLHFFAFNNSSSVFVTTLLGLDPFLFLSGPPSPSHLLSGFGFLHGDSLPQQCEHRGLAPTFGGSKPCNKWNVCFKKRGCY